MSERPRIAKVIVERYIANGSPMEVNLDDEVREDTLSRAKHIFSSITEQGDVGTSIPFDLFDSVMVELLHNLQDVVLRFWATSQFKRHLENSLVLKGLMLRRL